VPQALDRYLKSHPPADQRIETARRALVSREDLWKGRLCYVGRANLLARRTRAEDPGPAEWITRAQAPAAP
jgi:hypothetical protein